ncbi:MAG: hypothetical protein V1748_04670 [Actinomycetota bacterium]
MPQIAVDGVGNAHLVWQSSSQNQIYYSTNAGGGWAVPVALSATSTDNGTPRITLDATGIPHVVWMGNDGATYNIFYSKKMTACWSAPVIVSTTSTDNNRPEIALDGTGHPHVSWEGNDGATRRLYYSARGSGTWSTPEAVSALSGNGYSLIGADVSGHPSLVWSGYDGSTNRIYYSTNTGAGWDAPQNISTTATGNRFPDMRLDSSGRPRVTWEGYEGSTWRIYYSENDGGGWAAPKVLSNTPGGASGPKIALDGGGVPHVAWYGNDSEGQSRIYYARRGAGGWSTPINISGTDNGGNIFPEIGVDQAGHPHATWEGPTGTMGIYYARNMGSGWSDPVVISTVHESNFNPKIAVDGSGCPHVTWEGNLEGVNPQILYSADLQDNSTWYLAEGTNAWGFQTYITIENPNYQTLSARLTYMYNDPVTASSGVFERIVSLPSLSQTTISSEPDIGQADFSTRVECLEGERIAVDRTMSWTGEGARCPEGHSSIGVTAPATMWYLPEGSSEWGFETWTLVQNPNPTEANVTLTYMTEDEGPKVIEKKIPSDSRASYEMAADIGVHDSSIEVTSDLPVIAERSQYRNHRREGSCSIGATAPSLDYYLAEGSTAWGFTTYVLVQNPNDSEVDVTLTYMTPNNLYVDENEPVAQPPFTMPANSRKTIRVNDALQNADVSTRVHADKPVIAERAMYWNGGADSAEICHASIGISSPYTTFYLPDAQITDGWETWILVQNPNEVQVEVDMTFFGEGGGAVYRGVGVPAHSRVSFNMMELYNYTDAGRASISVSTDFGELPIIVERAMYRYDRGLGTNTIGAFDN